MQMTFWIAMNSYFICYIAFTVLYLSRIYESFASFVRMCILCVYKVQDFMVFFVFWLFIFAYWQKSLGNVVANDSDKSDYAKLEGNVKQVMEIFRNTMGDFQIPSYVLWSNDLTSKTSSVSKTFSTVMIYYIWGVWLANVLFMCVVLLNLLIAVLSQGYEEALTDNFAVKYQFRCQMVNEATLIKEAVMWVFGIERSYIFCLSYSVLKDNDDEANQSTIK